MVQSVKATYRDGVLEPSESLDLADGDVVMLLRVFSWSGLRARRVRRYGRERL